MPSQAFAAFRFPSFLQECRADAGKNYSAAVYGVDAYEIQIEVNGAGGNPNIAIVGLPDDAVKESRDRVTPAIANSGYYWPRSHYDQSRSGRYQKGGPEFRFADRAWSVSRTIADLDGKADISPEHVSEAIQYRNLDRTLWV
jgi:predicted ATPase with chaperone activity